MKAKRCAERSRVSVSDHQYIRVGQSATNTAAASPRHGEPVSRQPHAITMASRPRKMVGFRNDTRASPKSAIHPATSIGKPGA